MGLLPELMATIIILVTKPFSLFKLLCIICVKTLFIIAYTWMELVRAAICFHVNIFWRIVIWTVALISLPVRILTALQRERLLEMHLQEMQIDLENLMWDRKELEGRLKVATKEHRLMEMMLLELEEEHDKAIVKIELLESKVQDLKNENNRLKEIQGRRLLSLKGQDDTGNDQNSGITDNYGIPYGIPSWKSGYHERGLILQDFMMHRDDWENESKSKTELPFPSKSGAEAAGHIYPFTPGITFRNSNMNEVLDQRRDTALLQSLFSAILSLLVGMIIWEAEDPCMPLVVALYTVVGMSLKSVVQFFSTIKNKPASDAVALLSFNWFLLGTLTYPTLPRVARMLAPLALSFVDQTLSWLGLSSN